LDCPVYPCLEAFNTIEELRQHLLEKHKRSIKKHGLQELLDYAQHGKYWYISTWRQIYGVVEK